MRPTRQTTTPLVRHATACILPLTLAVAAAVLVKSHAQPGDGFAAGVIASSGVALHTTAHGHGEVHRRFAFRTAPTLACCGLLLMVAVAFAPLLFGEPFLSHWPAPGEHAIELGTLSLHTSLLYDLGIALAVHGFVITLIDRLARIPEER